MMDCADAGRILLSRRVADDPDWLNSAFLHMRLPRHRTLQFGVFVAVLIAIIQLTLDRINLFLLIGEGFASVVNEYRLSPVSR